MIDTVVERITRFCNTVAAAWLLLLAFVVLFDVVGRDVFDRPFHGTKEVLSNSVVAILFLQIPFAILKGGMIRTTIVYDNAGDMGRRVIDGAAYVLGIVFFAGVGIGGWEDMIMGYTVKEYEGIGAFEFQTWPIRGVTVFWSFLAAFVYVLLLAKVVLGLEHDDRSGDIEKVAL